MVRIHQGASPKPKQQRELLQLFSKHWPYRSGAVGSRYQASYVDDGFRGLLGALNNVLGPAMAEQWLGNTEWFSLNVDWGCSDDFRDALKSVGNSKSEKKAGWGTLWHLATRTEDSQGHRFPEPPAKIPAWAKPAREIDTSTLAVGVVQKVGQLKKALVQST